MADIKKEITKIQASLKDLGEVLHVEEKRARIQEKEALMSLPDFWSDQQKAKKISQEVAGLKTSVDAWEGLRETLRDTSEMETLASKENDNTVLRDIEESLTEIKEKLESLEVQALFSGELDESNTIVSLHAGAGGTDAQDWTEMLTRMFLRFSESMDWDVEMIEESRGEEAGYKSVQFAVRGYKAYGYFRGEAGVHRLVRISPFDAEKMRHTAFALVEVIPELEEGKEKDFEIDEKTLRIDTYLSSGKGGQGVNTTYSAVRITHMPTNTVVTCQNERSQQQNKETAMKVLKSRLWARLQEEHKEKLDELKGSHKSPEWGNQIRSYVLHPYQMVKDHRSDFQSQDTNGVLDGDVGPFIEAYLRYKAKQD